MCLYAERFFIEWLVSRGERGKHEEQNFTLSEHGRVINQTALHEEQNAY